MKVWFKLSSLVLVLVLLRRLGCEGCTKGRLNVEHDGTTLFKFTPNTPPAALYKERREAIDEAAEEYGIKESAARANDEGRLMVGRGGRRLDYYRQCLRLGTICAE